MLGGTCKNNNFLFVRKLQNNMCMHPLKIYQTSQGTHVSNIQKSIYITVHTARFYVFHFTTVDKFYLARGTASGRGDRPQSPLRVTVIRGGSLSYGCIYKTHFSPIMLVSISMCVFSMILKYRTLYSKSKISLNREKLLKNDVNMSTILFIMERRK